MKSPTILSTLPKLNVPDGQQTIHDYDKENKHPFKHVFEMPKKYTTEPQKPSERVDFELRFKSMKSVRKSKKSMKKSAKKSVKKSAKKSAKKSVKKSAKKSVKKSAKKSAKKSVKKSAKKSAKK